MNLSIIITEEDLKQLVCDRLGSVLNLSIEPKDVRFLVKTKDNYKAEWENGKFKAEINKEDKL